MHSEEEVIADLRGAICRAVDAGFVTFISGMSRGVDIWAAELVLEYRCRNPELHLICACPFPGFERSWSTVWQQRCGDILCRADLKRFISPEYDTLCFQRRNQWMVDHSSLIIAVWNGLPSGTRNTIVYAERKGIPCEFLPG